MKRRTMTTVAIFFVVLLLAACGGGREAPTTAPEAPTASESTASEAQPAAEAVALNGDAANGQKLYMMSCSSCHGPEGEGVQGLGKDMTTSEFIAGLSDVELVEFIKVGRDANDPANTTGVAMLPKGGNPSLTDDQLVDIVAYVRSIHK